ncbi:PCMD domain-containing protein [Alistipes onderdonkii]|uniref:PCMD domain-containing protein n=1 Tax=Alistipes onderdonkii TaxID=328813 RepID=UPI00050A2686|nr:PCMD domain-containing protein [Alistipes onderdonkii]
MKKSLKLLFCATALASLAGCNKFDEADTAPDSGNGSLIKVYAKVAENDGTRANIHVGESAFTAEWEAGDALGILPVKTGGTAPATAAKFDYNTTSAAFEGSLNDFAAGGGNYYAFFPHAKVTGTTANLPFGNLRTQAGNDFNSAYDALVATPRAYTDDDEAGKADGKDVTFTLHRLTSILNFSIATPADKVKYLLLTAGGETQKLSASSLDFGLENGGAETVASLSTTDQSNVIALQYTPDAAGGDHVEAFFNVPADLYPTLTLDVIDSDNQMATVTVDRTEAFEAGTLYKKSVADLQFASIAAPSLVWPGEDGKEIGDVHDLTTDDSGMSLNYSAAVDIVVPGGIAGLKVDIESPALNAIGITTLNIFNETEIPGLGISYEMLGLSCGAQVQYQKACVFNITNLVPMILVLEQMGIDASLIYCQHTFNVTVTDLAGQSTTQPLIFDASKVTLASADLWANTATLALKSIPSNATSVSVQYKKSTETTWQDATVSNDKTMATIAPEWSEASPYQINPDKGVFAATTYDYKLDIDGTEFTGQFTTAPGMTIDNGNMDTWYFEDAWYPHSDATTGNLWATGNPGTKLIKDNSTKNPVNLTTPVEHESKQAAYLKSQLIEGKVLGFVSVTKFGAGNLFVGDFGEIVYSPQGAKVKFGKEYEFTARPTGLKLKYKNTVGNINYIGSKTGVSESDIDKARIFVCLCNWSGQHTVDTTKESTYFDPTDPDKQASEGEVIGYGDLQIGETHADWTEVTIPIVYNDKINKPGYNKKSYLVISCAASIYGDYLCGSTSNDLTVDDFEWVY